MKAIICLISYISIAMACSCPSKTNKDVYCKATSLSHVKVISYHKPDDDTTGASNVLYGVEHITTFKKPKNLCSLPPYVLTPSGDAACGLYLTVGEEYLMAGYAKCDGTINVYLCNQVTEYGHGGIDRWQSISPELRANLTKFRC